MTETEKAIIDFCGHHADWWPSTTQVQEMLALAQPEQEPVAWVCMQGEKHDIDFDQIEIDAIPVGEMLYTTPPQRTWVGLTDEEIDIAWRSVDHTIPYAQFRIDVAKAIEAKLKEKQT